MIKGGMAFLIVALASAASAEESTSWTDKVSIGGDFRYRHEYIKRSDQSSARQRDRFRVRLNLTGQVNEKITAKFRIATSDDASPISNNATMTENGSKKAIYIDIAALDWKMCEGANTVLGKQDNPLRITTKSELLYDNDYRPEGLSLSGGKNFMYRLGGFSLQERKPDANGHSEPDSWLLAGVLGYKFSFSESATLTVGGGYHNFTALKKNATWTVGSPTDFYGNSNSGARYLHDYQVGELFAEFKTGFGESLNATFYVDVINNFYVDEDNTGLLAGAQLQTLNEGGKADWTFGYAYQTTGKDATVSALNNSNLNNGIDGGIGHIFSVGKTAAKNTNVLLTYWRGQVDNSGNPYWIDRAAFDVSVNF